MQMKTRYYACVLFPYILLVLAFAPIKFWHGKKDRAMV
ncbi:hypothetical protein GTGU_02606 [Trabulsiella guamensis ATCC 49490]|uniref:Uncharacterized protein n=1 Tax=Trabulsiella guamensis ATCC 49490 TaxID=1005994 RepID=A0A085A8B0_9ENTR|nr:hypothetical protein GTGU_02606 [Trabulsiella guamensis ATCC 49490]